jgi:hypothetical protein
MATKTKNRREPCETLPNTEFNITHSLEKILIRSHTNKITANISTTTEHVEPTNSETKLPKETVPNVYMKPCGKL